MILREGTVDRDVFVANHEQNEYRIPDWINDWIVLDIGAHIGAFSYTCIQRGARHVYAYEPDSGNYTVAEQNLREFANSVTLSELAVWGSGPIKHWPLKLTAYGTLGTTVNTGGGSVVFGQGTQPVKSIQFDDAIQLALTNHDTDMVDLVKMDCEGSEWPILFTSKSLGHIRQIVGEFHEGILPFALRGRIQYKVDDLARLLEHHNFTVRYERHGTIEEGLGLFIAERNSL